MQTVLEHWLAGKLVALPNESDVNKISHSLVKWQGRKKGAENPYMYKFEAKEIWLYSADEWLAVGEHKP